MTTMDADVSRLLDAHLWALAAAVPLVAAVWALRKPRRTDPAPPVPAPAPAPPRLLVADDSAVVRARMQRLLSAAGHSATLARDGREALALFGDGDYALLITDLEMPELDGPGLIAALAGDERGRLLPVIVVSSSDALRAQVQRSGRVVAAFGKPWPDDQLLASVDLALARRSRERPPEATAAADPARAGAWPARLAARRAWHMVVQAMRRGARGRRDAERVD